MSKARKGFFYRLSFQWKLILSFILPLAILFTGSTYGIYQRISGEMTDQFLNITRISAQQINKNVDTYINEMIRLANMPLSDDQMLYVLQNMKRNLTETEKLEYDTYIMRSLFNIFSYSTYLNSVSLVTSDGKIYSEGIARYIGKDEIFCQEDWYNQMVKGERNTYIIGPRFAKNPLPFFQPAQVFTVAQVLVDVYGNRLGIVILDGKYKDFQNLFAQVEHDQGYKILVHGAEGNLLYGAHLTFGEICSGASYKEAITGTGHPLLVDDLSEETGCKVEIEISRDQLNSANILIFRDIGLMVLIYFLISGIFYVVISAYISRPLRQLTKQIRKIEDGDLTVSQEIKGSREIEAVSRELNQMVIHINKLLENLVEMATRRREAEYKALQNQINPHFLYNTLEVIRMRCIGNGQEEISEAIETLGRLFRISINRGGENFTTLKTELEHAASYISIQNFCSGDKYDLHIEVPPGLLVYKIPKLTLQPLVENSITHGLEMKPGEGHICIRAGVEDGILSLMVEDDGVGMSPEIYEELLDFLDDPESEEDAHGIGLKNVHRRVRIFFGSSYGIKIDSQENMGTCVVLTLPAVIDERRGIPCTEL